MNKSIKYILAAMAILSGLLYFTACEHHVKKTPQSAARASSFYYTCSMHPQVHEDHPGNCPICGMKLIRVETGGDDMNTNSLKLTATQMRLAAIETDTVREENTGTQKTISGIVTADENTAGELSARLAGRIQHLFIRTIGESVKIGQPVYSIYSENLQETEKEYLLALEQQQKLHNPDVDYRALISAAENKLKLWGLSASQIATLKQSGKVSATTIVLSTVNGTVSELNVHEGDYLTEGMTILKAQGLGTLWVQAQLYASESGTLKLNQQVNVSFSDLGGKIVKGKVVFVNPELSDASKVDLVRIIVPNPGGQLRPGMQAYVVATGEGNNLAVPTSAILTGGKGNEVWVKNSNGSFSPRMVETGEANRNFVQVVSGLSSGEVIVTNGAYLLNSEMIFKHGSGQSMAGMKM